MSKEPSQADQDSTTRENRELELCKDKPNMKEHDSKHYNMQTGKVYE
jgi:hypothetical protein